MKCETSVSAHQYLVHGGVQAVPSTVLKSVAGFQVVRKLAKILNGEIESIGEK